VQEGEREGKSLVDAMSDGALDGMQTFDGELEKLIHAGVIDKETGLSFATNRTNLQLVLETGGGGANDDVTPSGKFPAAPSKGKPRSAPSEMDDLIER
jgi:Tfp pilus assembly ATPase PilU